MRAPFRIGSILCAVLIATAAPGLAGSGYLMVTADELEWTDAASLPPGAKVAIVEGDPSKEGPFTIRIKVPANYSVPAHVHPASERATVLEGTIYMAAGEDLAPESATELGPGSVAVVEEGVPMIGFTRDEPAVFQLNGYGPWGITYLDPEDDPRKQATEEGE